MTNEQKNMKEITEEEAREALRLLSISGDFGDSYSTISTLITHHFAMAKEINNLKKSLSRYGNHTYACDQWHIGDNCLCGFTEALTGKGGE